MSRVPRQPDQVGPSPAFLLHKEGFSIKDYRLIARIGEGSFGQVWKAERGGFEVALKILKASVNSEETQRELKSLETLKKLHHRYLLHTENFWSDGEQLYIEMELADGGTLKDRFKACQAEGRAGIPEDELLKYFTETAKALDYLHSHRPVFLHRDIKPANVLLVKGCAKLGDFGLLRQVTGDNSSTQTQGGTIPYMAPESIKEDKFSIATDMFSFAVMYAELRQGSLPFQGNNQFQICERIMKENPKLTDIFHPDERKVLLKALSKTAEERFASCGDFVFELNRVVPWSAATTVPTSTASESGPPDTNPAKTTDGKSPKQTDHGTSRRNTPRTMDQIELPDPPSQLSGPQADATIAGGRQTHSSKPSKPLPPMDGSAKTTSAGTGKTNPYAGTEKANPITPPTTIPARKKKANRVLPALLLVAILGGVSSGIWFVLNQGERSAVRQQVDAKEYAKAVQHIKGANSFILPGQSELIKEVETKWWAALKTPIGDEKPDNFRAHLRDLKSFRAEFPQHAEASARETQLRQTLGKTIAGDVTKLLKARNLVAAESLVTANSDVLAEEAKALHAKIAKKRDVLGGLESADQEYKRKEFEKSLSSLKAVEALEEDEEDRTLRIKLRGLAVAGAEARETMHAKLVAELDQLNQAGDTKLAQVKLDEILKFRKVHPKSAYPAVSVVAASAIKLLPDAWRLLHGDKITAEMARQAVEPLRQAKSQFAQDMVFQKHLTALEAFVSAYEANATNWDIAAKALVQVVRDPAQPSNLAANTWPALLKLEATRGMLRFSDLREIDESLTKPHPDKMVRDSNAQLVSLVLERIAKQPPFPWYPAPAELAAFTTMCAKVQTPSERLSAIWAESLLRQNAAWDEISKITVAANDWYGGYVAALVKEKRSIVYKSKANQIEAANLLVEKLKSRTADVKPAERATRAVDLLREATTKTLERKGHEFTYKDEAANAVIWLTMSIQLAQPDQSAKLAESLIVLAYAAAKSEDNSALDLASTGLEACNSKDPQTLTAFHLVAQAALNLADTHAKAKKWNDAILASKIGQKTAFQFRTLDQKTAAEFNSKAVEIQASIEFAKKNDKADRYRVFAELIQKKPLEAFHLPLIAAKLENAPTMAERIKSLDDGERGLNASKQVAESEADKEKKDWWQSLRCKTMLKVADLRLTVLAERLKVKELDLMKNEAEIRTEYRKAIHWFQQAKSLEQYSGKPPGEIASIIGHFYYLIVPNEPKGETETLEALRDARAGQAELRAALKAFEAVPAAQRTPQQTTAITECKGKEGELSQLIKKWESK